MNKKIVFFALSTALLLTAFNVLASAGSANIENPIGVNSFPELLQAIASGVGALIGGLGVIMIIVSGILYLTSAGSPEKMGTAKKALIYAIVGISIGIAAPVIIEVIKGVLKTK